jgi:GTP-binding protein Era
MNALTGEKLSIITPKAQTTRHRIRGIVNGADYQVVFTDHPGILKPAYKLHESMMKFIDDAMDDADVFLYVVEVGEKDGPENILRKLNAARVPVLVLVNKIDKTDQQGVEQAVNLWKTLIPAAEILPLSALHGLNTEVLLNKVVKLLPEHEAYFSEQDLTDLSERFFVSEIIREKIFLYYTKEIPYSCEVEIESFKEEEEIIRILSVIHVERESQKAILIGHKGVALKKTATQARKEIENFLGKHVYLEIFIKVSKDWRNNEKDLRKFGYES